MLLFLFRISLAFFLGLKTLAKEFAFLLMLMSLSFSTFLYSSYIFFFFPLSAHESAQKSTKKNTNNSLNTNFIVEVDFIFEDSVHAAW